MAKRKLGILCLILLMGICLFLTLNAKAQWDFILPFRGMKLIALLLVAYAVSVSTILFQTLTHNRILTPYIMGFDTLYLLIQSVVVFSLGSATYASLPLGWKFFAEAGIMIVASMMLFSVLFKQAVEDLYRMILTGVIFGVLFRSLTSFIQRLIDPEEFSVIQSVSFAQFNVIKTDVLPYCVPLVVVLSMVIWRYRHQLDIMALGRAHAINLGINYRKSMMLLLCLIAILVSISTALVGPVTFFGLLVSGISYEYIKSHRHDLLIPTSFLIAAIALVFGQVIFEHLIGMKSVLSVVIEFLGGMMFIWFLLKRKTL